MDLTPASIVLIICFAQFHQSTCCIVEKIKEFQVSKYDKLCKNQFQIFLNGLEQRDKWAVNMISSYSNFDKSHFYGNSYDFGDFDRCLEIGQTTKEGEIVKGKHCLVRYESSLNNTIPSPLAKNQYNLEWRNMSDKFIGAVCIPSVCSTKTIFPLVEHIVNGTDLQFSRDYDQEVSCKFSEPKKLWSVDIFAIAAAGTLMFCLALSTFYDLWCRIADKKGHEALLSFSVISNLMDLFNTERNETSENLGYLSGIKALAYFGIIFIHSVTHRLNFPLRDPRGAEIFLKSPMANIVSGLFFNVDTFLLISGLLFTMKILNELKKGSFSYTKSIFLRFMRITPSKAFILLSVFYYLHQSPPLPYFFVKQSLVPCEKYWWAELLHIMNYVNVHQQCNPVFWYLSADFQLFLATPAIVYVTWKWKSSKFVVFPCIFLFLQGLTYIEVLRIEDFLKEFSIGSDFYGDYAPLYFQTHFRAAPWIVGIMIGTFMVKHKKFELNKKVVICMWIFSSAIFLRSFFPQLLRPLGFIPVITANERLLWALAMGWIIFACHYGLAECLKKFLGKPFWMPIEKFGLSLYLVHSSMILGYLFARKHPIDFDTDSIFHGFSSDCNTSLVAAIIFYLLVEKPFIVIGKCMARLW